MSEIESILKSAGRREEETGMPPFDREEWIEQKRAEREHAYELIDEAAELMTKDGERVRSYLDIQSRFPKFSVGNVLLLSIQKPDAVRLSSFRAWKDVGAGIRRGETGIILLEPGREYTREDGSLGVAYYTKRVFDISQTTLKVEPVPEVRRDERVLLKALIYCAPCGILADDSVVFPEKMSARYDSGENVIYTARDRGASELFREIARETAHAFMDREGIGREKAEFTAVMASYMVCRRTGADVSSFRFKELSESFTKLDSRGVRNELSKAREISNRICADMERTLGKEKDPEPGEREEGNERKKSRGGAER